MRTRCGRRGSGGASPRSCDLLHQCVDGLVRLLALGNAEPVARVDALEPRSEPRDGTVIARGGDLDHLAVLGGDRLAHTRLELALLRTRRRLGDPDAGVAAVLA